MIASSPEWLIFSHALHSAVVGIVAMLCPRNHGARAEAPAPWHVMETDQADRSATMALVSTGLASQRIRLEYRMMPELRWETSSTVKLMVVRSMMR